MMDFDEYQKLARRTAVYDGQGEFSGLAYTGLGLTGEAGEGSEHIADLLLAYLHLRITQHAGQAANQTKKVLRDDQTGVTPERRERILDEIGDLLWYAANECAELDAKMSDVAEMNIAKLAKRYDNDHIRGDHKFGE